MTHMAACRDVDPARLEALNLGAPLPPVYPGSVKGNCRACAVEVWIGPRLQQAIETLPDVHVMCFPCGAAANASAVVNLGNPYTPEVR